jgi:hypothetical protein
MFKPVFVSLILLLICSFGVEARPIRISHASECNVTMPCDFSFLHASPRYLKQQRLSGRHRVTALRESFASADSQGEQIVGGRPAGCPHAFCGCGAAIHIFGHVVPELNLAANWLRFPRTAPAPGMVAARSGHVFVLEQLLGGDMWMAYDANSGGSATRIHARSVRGYTIVNPHAG